MAVSSADVSRQMDFREASVLSFASDPSSPSPRMQRQPSSVRSEPPAVRLQPSAHSLPAYSAHSAPAAPPAPAPHEARATNETLGSLFTLARDVRELAESDRGRVRGTEELALRAREVRSVLDEYRDFVHLHAFAPLVQRALATIRHALLGAKETLRRALRQSFRRNAKYKEAVQMCLNNLQQALTRLGHALSLSQGAAGSVGGGAMSYASSDANEDDEGAFARAAEEPGERSRAEGDRHALERRWVRAAHCYRQAARAGSARGAVELARLMRDGRAGGPRDHRGARRLLEEAGSGEALHELGLMTREGEGARADAAEAARLFRESAALGCAAGMYELARWLEAEADEADPADEALELYERAAELGHAAALNRVGVLWAEGAAAPDGRPDRVEACRWFARAADEGSAEALYNLGVCAEPDAPGAALELFERAAAAGHAGAAASVGYHLLRRGEEAAAVEHLRRAAEAGSPEGAYFLGVVYSRGASVPACPRTAFDYFSRAAAAGHARARRRAADGLFSGAGVPRDTEAAFALYKLAADQGEPEAANSLGIMLEAGDGAIQSHEQAVYWYERAAAAGLADAVHNLAAMHERGLGVPRDERAAQRLYREAARAGSLHARARLARDAVRREGPPPAAVAMAVAQAAVH